jgi:hypothetical protein
MEQKGQDTCEEPDLHIPDEDEERVVDEKTLEDLAAGTKQCDGGISTLQFYQSVQIKDQAQIICK